MLVLSGEFRLHHKEKSKKRHGPILRLPATGIHCVANTLFITRQQLFNLFSNCSRKISTACLLPKEFSFDKASKQLFLQPSECFFLRRKSNKRTEFISAFLLAKSVRFVKWKKHMFSCCRQGFSFERYGFHCFDLHIGGEIHSLFHRGYTDIGYP